jgi:hypothetical protein
MQQRGQRMSSSLAGCVVGLVTATLVLAALGCQPAAPGGAGGTAPANLDHAQDARIEQAVSQTKIGPTYQNREQLARAMFALKVPGSGMTSFGEKPQSDGSILAGFSVEIPQANKERVLVFRGQNGIYTLIDDFITAKVAGDSKIMAVVLQGGSLLYSSLEGKELLRRPLAE